MLMHSDDDMLYWRKAVESSHSWRCPLVARKTEWRSWTMAPCSRQRSRSLQLSGVVLLRGSGGERVGGADDAKDKSRWRTP